MIIGELVTQPEGYRAFIPSAFPPAELTIAQLPQETSLLCDRATLLLGRLDGMTQNLPDLDFFVSMYFLKEAEQSSQIEGTKANLIDALDAKVGVDRKLPADVSDIINYLKAMHLGIERIATLPLSSRLICEVHRELMTDGRSNVPARPGELRQDQNWIEGSSPFDARFVPPPPHEMQRALGDLDKFLNSQDQLQPLIKAAIAHAQFETIHPFRDGNGRTGRLLVTLYLVIAGILRQPTLYLSSYLRKNRERYFDLLNAYHSPDGRIVPWINFFLQGIEEISKEAIQTVEQIILLREKDIERIHKLGSRAKTALKVLQNLYGLPIVNVRLIQEWTGQSKDAANRLARDLINIGILQQRENGKKRNRSFEHADYLKLFLR